MVNKTLNYAGIMSHLAFELVSAHRWGTSEGIIVFVSIEEVTYCSHLTKFSKK